MNGAPEQDGNGVPVLDKQGRERVVITGGKGDQGLRRMIACLRKNVLRKVGKARNSSVGEAA